MIWLRRTRLDRGDSRKELNMENKHIQTRTLAGLAILTAVVVILQLLGSFIHFGIFSISLVLIPIVVGAALYGAGAGAWLGFVFSVVVLIMDSAAFMVVDPLGTVVTVLLKGTLAGFCAGLVYRLLSKSGVYLVIEAKSKDVWSTDLGVAVAASVCPVVNTGIFLLGCLVFFLPTINEWAANAGFASAGKFMIFGLVGANFLFELLFNIILSPLIVRLIEIGRKGKV